MIQQVLGDQEWFERMTPRDLAGGTESAHHPAYKPLWTF
jgi:hypothetical protein